MDSNEDTAEFTRLDVVIAAYLRAEEAGEKPDREQWLQQHADMAESLRAFFADRQRFEQAAAQLKDALEEEGDRADQSHYGMLDDGSESPSGLPRVRYFGDYEILGEIARGGMGVVYKARQVSLNRAVAIKMILSGQLASTADVQRFRREAEAAANLDHPNILPIYEVGEHEGQHYFSMKLIAGGSLTALVPALQGKAKQVAKLVEAIARAVHFAHQHGILHRDLKPANILIDADGAPVITDFGLAKQVGGDLGMTQSGATIGTPSYMPPEQARGAKDISTSADVYSLGAILYELLTGRPPFKGETVAQTLRLVEEREPASPRSLNRRIDKDLSTVTLKCLEKNPAKRYASAEALADDLQRWRKGQPVTARRAGPIRRTRKWLVRNPIPTLLMLTAVVATTVIGVSLMRTRAALADARWQMYVSALLLAGRDVNEHNFDQAEAQLKRAPEESRNWEWRHLHRVVHPEAAVWDPEVGSMESIAGSRDGKTILVSTSMVNSCLAALLDPETGKKTVEFKWPREKLSNPANITVSLSADGQRIAVCDGTTALFFDRDGTLLKTLTWPAAGTVRGMALDSNGRRIAVITKDYHVQVRDIETGDFSFDQRRGEIIPYQACWRDSDRQLVVLYQDGLGIDTLRDPKLRRQLKFVDIAKQMPANQNLKNEIGHYQGLAISPDGKTAAIGGVGIILIIDLETLAVVGKLECEPAVRGANWRMFIDLQGLVFSHDGRYLVGVSPNDRAVRIWDVNFPQPIAVQYGHQNGLTGAALVLAGRVVTVGYDRRARLWEVPPRAYPLALPGAKSIATYMDVSRDGNYMAVGEDEGYVSLFDTQSDKLLWRVRPATRAITQLTFSPDGQIGVAPGWQASHSPRGAELAKANLDATVLETATGATLFKLAAAPGEWSMVTGISFRSDGQRILTASGITDARVDSVRQWDAATGLHIADLDVGYVKLNRGADFAVDATGVAHDPSGRDEFAVCGVQATVDSHICSAADGSHRESLLLNGGNTVCYDFWVGYSRDGRFVITHDETSLGAWEPHASLTRRNHTLQPCQNCFRLENLPRIQQVAISPDGLRLALACEDFIILRSTLTGEELIRIPVSSCEAVAFHPDGERLYAGQPAALSASNLDGTFPSVLPGDRRPQ